MTQKYPPLLLKYLKMFQEDPSSRIFAPLAEAYRKIGLIDEAIDICIEGLAANPHFTGGKVALARAYFDKRKYQDVREILRPIVDGAPDNLLAQRLYADASFALGYVQDAVNAYKLILYFNPADTEIENLLQEMETQLYQGGGLTRLARSPEKLRKVVRLQRILEKFERAARAG